MGCGIKAKTNGAQKHVPKLINGSDRVTQEIGGFQQIARATQKIIVQEIREVAR